MGNSDNLYGYKWAKENMNVSSITRHYMLNHEVVGECTRYVWEEENAKERLARKLLENNFDKEDIEDLIFLYGSNIQDDFFEIGLKVGAKLGAEYLIKKDSYDLGKW